MDTDKTLVQTIEQLRDDLKSFIVTRYELLRVELSDSMKRIMSAAMLVGTAALVGAVGLMLLGICASLAIAFGFGAVQSQVGLIWGFLITGAGSLLLAGLMGAAGKARLTAKDLAPTRTMQVLQRDQETMRNQEMLKKGPGEEYGDESIRRRA
jgi:uncharacterized membrane protein YqjE